MANGDIYKPVSTGDNLVIPAGVWNELLAGLKRTQSRQGGAAESRSRGLPLGWVYVKNTTVSTIPRFGPVGLVDPLFGPDVNKRSFLNRSAFTGIEPTAADYSNRFAIVQRAIKPGKIGKAIVSGITNALLDECGDPGTTANVNGTTATLTPGSGGNATILSCIEYDSKFFARVLVGGAASGTSFGLVVAPSVRTEAAGAKPAWIRPAGYPGDNDHVFVWPSDEDGTPIGTPVALSTATEDQFVRVELTGRGGDPSLFDGDVIRYELTGDKYYLASEGWYDQRIGDTRRVINPDFNVGEGRGWFWKDDALSHDKPCSDADTLGASVSNKDIEQTIAVEQGDHGFALPVAATLGVVGTVFEAYTPGEQIGVAPALAHYERTLERYH